ncbi:MAG: GxxExxY protein [candidate division WOR-3 bacterium]|nr:GxxExxY protein [candidate division WOR-3 bacterium]
MEFDELSNRVIGCAIEVHRQLGPGLLESTYEQCLAHELKLNGIRSESQHPQPVEYKGVQLDCGYRVDLLVEDKLIISGDVVNGTGYSPQVLFVSFVVKNLECELYCLLW